MKKWIISMILLAGVGAAAGIYLWPKASTSKESARRRPRTYLPWQPLDTSGFLFSHMRMQPWKDPTSLEEVRQVYDRIGYRNIEQLDRSLAGGIDREQAVKLRLIKASFYLYE